MSEFVVVTEPVTGVVVTVSKESVQARLWAVSEPVKPEQQEGEAPAGNASRGLWAEHAVSLGVEVPEDAKRDDIKALVEAHEAAKADEQE